MFIVFKIQKNESDTIKLINYYNDDNLYFFRNLISV